MKVTNYTGKVFAIIDTGGVPVVDEFDISKGYYDGSIVLTKDGFQAEYEDYREDYDVYYHMSDDGSQFYNSCRILESIDTLIPPSHDVLKKPMFEYIQRLYGKVDPMDVTFAMNTFSNPIWIHKWFVSEGGDVNLAHEAMYNEQWKNYVD